MYLCTIIINVRNYNIMAKKKAKMTIGVDDYIKINKKLSRLEEFERNGGGQFVAKDRPHKNLKKYDRKRDKKNFNFDLSLYFFFI